MPKLYEKLIERAERNTLRGHMPGHKGVPLLGVPAETIDFTELSDTGNLYDADENVIREAERDAARAAGAAACVYSAGGSTLLIQGMLGVAAQRASAKGRTLRVLAARDAHRSFFSAMALLGGDADYIYPQYNDEWNISEGIRADDVRAALAERDYDAVYVTSPTYYGVLSDLAGIAAACADAGVLLLIDAAHGAHLVGGEPDALPFGIDPRCTYIMCCSAHKTLGALGGSAFALMSDESLHSEMLASMQLFGSSSPSYVILASLDKALADASSDAGKAALAACAARVAQLRERVAAMAGVRVLNSGDPTRFVFSLDGASGFDVAEWLERERGVAAEMADSRSVVFIMTAQDSEADFARLEAAIADCAAAVPCRDTVPLCRRVCIPRDGKAKTPPKGRGCGDTACASNGVGEGKCQGKTAGNIRGANIAAQAVGRWTQTHVGACALACVDTRNAYTEARQDAPTRQERVCSLRSALFAPTEMVILRDAAGRVAAEAIAPYPPGVPIIAPGEKISQKTIAFFIDIGYNVDKRVRVLAPQTSEREDIQ